MSQENAALARRWFEEVWNQRKAEVDRRPLGAGELRPPRGRQSIRTREEFKAMRAEFLAALPDLQITVEQILTAGG